MEYPMDEKALYWTSVVFGVLALLLLIANVVLIDNNHSLQHKLMDRQQEINQGDNLGRLNQNLAQALAQTAVRDDDNKIRDLLKEQGIMIKNPAKPDKPAKGRE